MDYRDFNGVRVSRLGMGNMRLPSVQGKRGEAPIDYPAAHEMIDLALRSGVNYFDTAYVYQDGDSERCLGEALKKYPRNSFYLATKFNYRANPDYKAVFQEELDRLQTDHIDFYLLHCMTERNVDSYLTCGCIEYFEQMKKEGKITYLGFSSHAKPETLRHFVESHKWDFAQIQMNYFDWEFSTTEEEYNILTEHNIPIVVMEPVRGGRLSTLTPELDAKLKAKEPNWSVSSWALRWVMAHENVHVILSGMSTIEQVRDNLDTFLADNALDQEHMDFLKEIVHEFKHSITVPCTSCRYCTPHCPMQLDIPVLLAAYNKYKFGGEWNPGLLSDIEEDKMPSCCISCGSCIEHCPQNIEIPTYMAKLRSLNLTGKEL